MNLSFPCFISFLICSIVVIQLTSSASFPNPPPYPAANATNDEWLTFMKLLHNYYAIIARPRFGKRYDSIINRPKLPSLLEVINPQYNSLSSLENNIDTDDFNFNQERR